MKLKEIREQVSKEYELKPGAKYLLVLDRRWVSTASLHAIRDGWEKLTDTQAIFLHVPNAKEAVKLLEIKE